MKRQHIQHNDMIPSRDGIGYSIVLTFMLLLLCFSESLSQSSYKSKITKNTIYIEILGSAPLFAISYGRQIIISPKDQISVDVGYSYSPYITSKFSFGASPQISYLHGVKNHIELGIGVYHDFYWGDNIPFPKFGYRFQKKTGGFMFKAEFTPLFVYFQPINILPWGGIGLGWSF